jgi:ferrous iron transport protein B
MVDLPGTYSLTANSEEERIARDFIICQRPDVVVAIVNAAALERNLYLLPYWVKWQRQRVRAD